LVLWIIWNDPSEKEQCDWILINLTNNKWYYKDNEKDVELGVASEDWLLSSLSSLELIC